jgi:hypothetical protein
MLPTGTMRGILYRSACVGRYNLVAEDLRTTTCCAIIIAPIYSRVKHFLTTGRIMIKKRMPRGTKIIVCDCKSEGWPLFLRRHGSYEHRYHLGNPYVWHTLQIEMLIEARIIRGSCENCGRFFALKVNFELAEDYGVDADEYIADHIYANPSSITVERVVEGQRPHVRVLHVEAPPHSDFPSEPPRKGNGW